MMRREDEEGPVVEAILPCANQSTISRKQAALGGPRGPAISLGDRHPALAVERPELRELRRQQEQRHRDL